MTRVRWRAGSDLTAEEFKAEQQDLDSRRDEHRHAHGSAHDGVVGSRVRAVDGSVELLLQPVDTLRRLRVETPDKSGTTITRRSWAVSIGRDILALGWQAGARLTGRVRGNLASAGLSCSAVRLTQAGAAPDAPRPFRLLRVAADRKAKTPETLMIELVAAADPATAKATPDPAGGKSKDGKSSGKPKTAGPPLGMRIGPSTTQGFLPLLEIVPGRGVVVRGNVTQSRRIARRPPDSEPSDEQLMQAFLRTEAGKAELDRIKKEAAALKDSLKIVSNDNTGSNAEHQRRRFHWTLTNTKTSKLTRLKAMAAFMPAVATPGVALTWVELSAPDPRSIGEGETSEGDSDISVLTSVIGGTGPFKLQLMINAESDYGVPVTVFGKEP